MFEHMFEVENSWVEDPADKERWDLEVEAVRLEKLVGRVRVRQAEIVARLDVLQVDAADGDMGMKNWVSRTLDVAHQTAHRLMTLAHTTEEVKTLVGEQGYGLDRAYWLTRLAACNVGAELLAEAGETYSLGRLAGLADRLRTHDSWDETAAYENRFLVLQPSLDDSAWRLWGMLPPVDGETIHQALTKRESLFPHSETSTGARQADALTSICLDSLTGTSGEGEQPPARAVVVAEVLVDAGLAAGSYGEQGAAVSAGPRTGPNTLEEILCEGKVRVTVSGSEAIAWSDLGEAVPPALRQLIWLRDQGQCSIPGCRSRYRLQIHHLIERSRGGGHEPDNLALVCWYHHHIVIHGKGYRIDPKSPIHRRRLIPPQHQPRPPPDDDPPGSTPLELAPGMFRDAIAAARLARHPQPANS